MSNKNWRNCKQKNGKLIIFGPIWNLRQTGETWVLAEVSCIENVTIAIGDSHSNWKALDTWQTTFLPLSGRSFAKLGHILPHCLHLCFGSMHALISKGFQIGHCQQKQKPSNTGLFLVSVRYNSHSRAKTTKTYLPMVTHTGKAKEQRAPQNPHAFSLSPLPSRHMHQLRNKALAKQHNPLAAQWSTILHRWPLEG